MSATGTQLRGTDWIEVAEGDEDQQPRILRRQNRRVSHSVQLGLAAALIILAPHSALCESFDALARRWAPVVFQDTDVNFANPSGRYDFLTAIDFDGDLDGRNNWENAANTAHALRPYVYYSVCETVSHYYIAYAFFHPRDWHPTIVADEHENDLEGIVLTIRKTAAPFGELRVMGCVFHKLRYYFKNDDDISILPFAQHPPPAQTDRIAFYPTSLGLRPAVFLESKGHGVSGTPFVAMTPVAGGVYEFANLSGEFSFRENDGVRYECSDEPDAVPTEPPSPSFDGGTYQLLPIDQLWHAADCAGSGCMFEEERNTFFFLGGCVAYDLPAEFVSTHGSGRANPPWAWDCVNGCNESRIGHWYLEPAESTSLFLNVWPDEELPGYYSYQTHEFYEALNRIEVIRPAADEELTIGGEIQIDWRFQGSGSGISGPYVVELSRNNGDSWEHLGTANVASQLSWAVTGPSSDSCILRVTGNVNCDIALTVVGYGDEFAIQDIDGNSPDFTFGGAAMCLDAQDQKPPPSN